MGGVPLLDPYETTIITAFISSIVAALVGALVAKAKTLKKAGDQARIDAEESREMQKQTLLMTCRLAIYDEHFSVDEKLDTYDIYRSHGGNHQTKRYMDEVVGGDVDEYLEKHGKKKGGKYE